MARKTINIPTTQELEKLYAKGDIAQLRAINERLAKTANQRMVQLYKSNMETESLRQARFYLDQVSEVATGGVFSRSKKLDAEDLIEQIKQEAIFLRSEGSTVSGIKEARRSKIFDTMTSEHLNKEGELVGPIIHIPKDVTVPEYWKDREHEYFKKKFLDFLATDAWKDVKKFLYAAEDTSLFKEAGEAIARGASLTDLNDMYTSYLRNEISIYDMWDSWTSVLR